MSYIDTDTIFIRSISKQLLLVPLNVQYKYMYIFNLFCWCQTSNQTLTERIETVFNYLLLLLPAVEPSAWFQQHKYQPPPRPSPGCHEMSLHSCCFCWSETQLIVMMMMMTRECVPQLGMELDF